MITLKELIDEQRVNGNSDIQIIKTFFTLNDMEQEGMDLIHELTKSKIEKMNRKRRMAEEWASILPSKYLYENYDLDIADKLHTLEINYLVNGGELSSNLLEWASENVPKIIRPEVYFNPLVEWLERKGIKFKNSNDVKIIDVAIVPTAETSYGIADRYDIIEDRSGKILHEDIKQDELLHIVNDNNYSVISGEKYM